MANKKLKVYIGYNREEKTISKRDIVRGVENYIDIAYKYCAPLKDLYATKVNFHKSLPFSDREYRTLHFVEYSNKYALPTMVLDEAKVADSSLVNISTTKIFNHSAILRWYNQYISDRANTSIDNIEFSIPIFGEEISKTACMYGIITTASKITCEMASPVSTYCGKCLSKFTSVSHTETCLDRTKVIDVMYNDMRRLYDGQEVTELVKLQKQSLVKMVPSGYHYFVSKELKDLIKLWNSNKDISSQLTLSEFIKVSISD